MDSLFDDKPYEVGDEIEAYCPNARCRGDTVHLIRGMYESEIRRVECTVCGDLHGFRKPRGIPYDDEPAQESALKKRSSKLKKPSWEEAMAKVTERELANCRPYSTLDNYELLDVVSHPLFEIGFITELLPDNKIEVTFKDKARILVHRKKQGGEFASKISELPAPRQTRSRRKKRRKNEGPSELAQRLMSERMLSRAGTKNFEEVAVAKEELAEKAALENRRLALEMVARKLEKGIELTDAEKAAAKDARRLQRDEEKRRKAEEREKIRLEREKQREKKRREREREREKARKQKEREREKARKQKERERAKRQREREKEEARRVRERARQEKERERQRKKKLAEQMRKKREQERRKKAAERTKAIKAKAALRRTGGKKSIPAQRRTGGKKSIPAQRRTGGKKSIPKRRR